MAKFSVREVIEMALQTEKLGYAFYTETAKKFPQAQELNKLFTTLATMELAHEQVFSRLLRDVKDTEPEQWDEVQGYFRAMVESQFFLGAGKSLPNLDNVATVAQAVDFALGFEKETTLFFIGLRTAVKDRTAVDKIIEEEMRHVAWLQAFKGTLKS